MSNKKRNPLSVIRCPYLAFAIMFAMPAAAEMEVDITTQDARPVFQQIADFEQERILLQLEREKAQLMLDLDRMALEQARLRADAANISERGSPEVQRLEEENQKLERAMKKMELEKEKLEEKLLNPEDAAATDAKGAARSAKAAGKSAEDSGPLPIFKRFRLVEIVGVNRQLQATVEDLVTGQKRRVQVGHKIDGYDVKSISLDEGVVFVKDGAQESLTVSSSAKD
ncbi:MAG: type IV pilus biogenesis protein PilP [Alphaproteobacteria bacterium]|nr:type IV pilus biogenesis protein PilP [Alphaproteobacteria bacterium]